ncbi:MAG: hypothetical protein FJY85_04285 [Deltaproteobacteria bacterium]|nr:hypothetical protein [Deltaproteobacteria bacterium]
MAKRQIRIREAIADVRSGMTDTELMEKYQLAAKGLQSLFAKLIAAKLITIDELEQRMPGFMPSATLSGVFDHPDEEADWKITWQKPGQKAGQLVNARDAANDIRSGLGDAELMQKYHLTSKGVEDLFDQLVAARLITKEELDQRMPSADSTVDLRGIIEGLNWDEIRRELEEPAERSTKCPSCGQSYDQQTGRCPSCGYSASKKMGAAPAKKAAEAQKPKPQKPSKTAPQDTRPVKRRSLDTVDLDALVADVREGLLDGELMDKHGLSFLELDEVFKRLLEANLISRGELYGRSSFFSETLAIYPVPESSAHYLAFPIPISDAINSQIVGRLRNVSEKEIGVVGIEAEVGEVRSFVVFPERFVDIPSISFDATCTWVAKQPEGVYARFQITSISGQDESRLKKMIGALTFGL